MRRRSAIARSAASFGTALLAATASVALSSPLPEGGRGEAVIDGRSLGKAGEGGRYTVNASRCGERLSTEWRYADGSLAAYEEVELAEGRWVRYRLQRTNIRQDLRAERRGDVVTITDGAHPERSPTRLTGRGTLVAGPELVLFLQSRLADLRAGRAVELQYLLADRGSTLAFKARGRADGPSTVVSLEVSSALARPFVPTTTFEFGADGGLRQVVGRLLPMAGDVRAAKSLDGVLKMRAAQSTCNRKSVS